MEVQKFKPSVHIDDSLLSKSHKSIWVRILDKKDLSVVTQRQRCPSKDINARLDSNAITRTEIKINYFYGCEGNGTLVMNTWINLARYLYFDNSKLIVYGEITEDDPEKLENVIKFYEKFGFIVKAINNSTDYRFKARLIDLKIIPHNSDTSKEYLLKPFMFKSNNEDNSLLSEEISSLNKPTSILL